MTDPATAAAQAPEPEVDCIGAGEPIPPPEPDPLDNLGRGLYDAGIMLSAEPVVGFHGQPPQGAFLAGRALLKVSASLYFAVRPDPRCGACHGSEAFRRFHREQHHRCRCVEARAKVAFDAMRQQVAPAAPPAPEKEPTPATPRATRDDARRATLAELEGRLAEAEARKEAALAEVAPRIAAAKAALQATAARHDAAADRQDVAVASARLASMRADEFRKMAADEDARSREHQAAADRIAAEEIGAAFAENESARDALLAAEADRDRIAARHDDRMKSTRTTIKRLRDRIGG